MSSDMPSLSPEELQVEKIFDLIWMELRENRGLYYFGQFEPGVLRDEIARRVAHHSNSGKFHAEDVTQSVLHSFGIGGTTNWRV